MPQRPYLPLGTLRHALLYPADDDGQPGRGARRTRSSVAASRISSPGLTRRTSGRASCPAARSSASRFARLLVNPPDIIIMDESTAALDEESQARMLEFLRTDLAPAMVLCVAHRPGLEEYFDRELKLVRLEEAGPAKAQPPAAAALPQPPERLRGNRAGERRGPCAGGRGGAGARAGPDERGRRGRRAARERSGALRLQPR